MRSVTLAKWKLARILALTPFLRGRRLNCTTRVWPVVLAMQFQMRKPPLGHGAGKRPRVPGYIRQLLLAPYSRRQALCFRCKGFATALYDATSRGIPL
jgi:hypothetical protein